MRHSVKLAKTRKGQRDASLSKFGSKQLDGGLPNEDIISPFYDSLSNSYYPLGVIVEPANKKKLTKILITTRFRCAGKGIYTSSVDTRMASLASNRRNANSKMVSRLLVTIKDCSNGVLSIGVPKASK
jgi:hypothetical protein